MNTVTGVLDVVPIEIPCCYIAAPFFNPPQLELVKSLESVFSSQKRWAFSPRLQHGEKPVAINTKHIAAEVFLENYRAIQRCDFMVAVVDWLMPPSIELRVVKECNAEGLPYGPLFESKSPPLNLPDTGTVWEMGMAFALKKPVVMFTVRPPTDKLNIMLTESCVGIARGVERLAAYLRGEQLEQWEGRYT